MDPIHIAHLIAKQQIESLTPKENNELDRWLENERNKALYHSLLDKKQLEIKLNKYRSIDTRKAKEKYLEQITPKRTIRTQLLRVVAIAVLVLALGSVVYIINKSLNNVQSTHLLTEVHPGISKARLVLDDGSIVELNQNDSITLIQEGAVVRGESGKINYQSTSKKIASVKYNTLEVPSGGEYQITLPDGTQVWVNSETKLKYPVQFNKEMRLVELSGEAYFKVAHNDKQPFVVQTSSHAIKVLGTEFNIRAYNDDKIQHTTLIEGSVSARYNGVNGISVDKKIVPNQQIAFNTETEQAKITTVDAYVYTAWKDGRFVFRNQPLKTILKRMSRWYDVDVEYSNQYVADKSFSIDMRRNDSFDKVIRVLELTGAVSIDVKGKKVIIKDISE